MRLRNKFIFILLLILLPVFAVFPQNKTNRGDYLTIKIAVIGPGDQLYFWWGHLGLIVDDALTGESLFYDYGVFSFNNDHFFSNFAMGRLIYSSAVSSTDFIINRYLQDNRDITLYTLNLNSDQKEEIREFAEWNALPENKDYLYNHFTDNCVTRVTNILDNVLGGQFYGELGKTQGRMSLREHVRRHTWFSPFWDWLLNFLMGQGIDGPTTVQEEMFLPSEMGSQIANFEYFDSNGSFKKLVSDVEVINRAKGRYMVLDEPPLQWPKALCLGIFIAALFVVFKKITKKKPVTGRRLYGIGITLLGIWFGISGSVLFFMTFFTNHDYTWHNSNVIYINLLFLGMIPLGIMFAAAKNEKKQSAYDAIIKAFMTYVFLGDILSMVIKISPDYYQQNQVTQLLILPVALVLSFLPDWLGPALGGKKWGRQKRP